MPVAFAHDVPFQADLVSAIRAIRPTVLVGVSTLAGAFTEEVVKLMAGRGRGARGLGFGVKGLQSRVWGLWFGI
jgi:hypothetical protein